MDNYPEKRSTSEISKVSKIPIGYSLKVVNMHKHSQKARTYDEALIVQMTNRFNALVYTMGFEDPVEADTMQVLILWIKEQFGGLSMEEMIYAFQMATAHNLPGVTRHYKNFDMQYCGDVLNAYKSYKIKQLKIFKDEDTVRKAAESSGKSITGEEMYSVLKKIALKKGEIMKIADWSSAFEYAWTKGYIPTMDKSEVEKYRNCVIEALKSESRANIGTDMRSTLKLIDNQKSLDQECRKRMMKAHFQEMIDKK